MALLALGDVPYDDAKKMTEDQIISLYHRDHNILHETGHPDRDKFWNLVPRLIREHRNKTKQDAKIIAKSRRIRGYRLLEKIVSFSDDKNKWDHDVVDRYLALVSPRYRRERKLRSRGFNKTLKRKMDGTVVPR